jgi:hypothetical protein
MTGRSGVEHELVRPEQAIFPRPTSSTCGIPKVPHVLPFCYGPVAWCLDFTSRLSLVEPARR